MHLVTLKERNILHFSNVAVFGFASRIKVIPTIVLIKDAKSKDYIVGFTDLGEADLRKLATFSL